MQGAPQSIRECEQNFFLTEVLGVREALEDVVFLSLIQRRPASEFSLDIR